MTTPELNNILKELYRLEPELREHEEALRRLIIRMTDIKPDTRFDPAFAARLKAELAGQTAAGPEAAESRAQNLSIFNLNFMNKKIYFAAGTVAVMAVLILMMATMLNPGLKMSEKSVALDSVSNLPAGAFGNLATLNLNAVNNANGAPAGLGGGGTESGAFASRTQSGGGSGGDIAVTATADAIAPVPDAKMIAPYYAYRYEYKGENLDLSDSQGDVYRRIKGDGQSGRALAGLLGGLSLPGLDLSTFSNLKATNLSLVEDKDAGLMVSFDFNEDNIYISENWEKWRILERENCGGDQACWDRWRLDISDVPADSELIAMADRFLADHNISREHYGDPQVDNQWREIYTQMADKANFYVPEYSTVVYPLLINGEPARDQSGSYTGLRVTINLIKKAASGISGLTPYRYQTSSYQLETDAANVLKAAEKGGWNSGWFGGSENIRTLELGTPERVYVQIWRYENARNDELLVPALVFPILNRPTDMYYGPRSVIVPLVKEMLDELNKQPQVMPLPVDGPVIMTEPATEPAKPEAAAPGSETAETPATQPSILR